MHLLDSFCKNLRIGCFSGVVTQGFAWVDSARASLHSTNPRTDLPNHLRLDTVKPEIRSSHAANPDFGFSLVFDRFLSFSSCFQASFRPLAQ